MKKPTIHLNGSSPTHLIASYVSAAGALREALRLVGETQPNARDYYPQGDDAFKIAAEEHRLRASVLELVLSDIRELHEHVVDEVDRQQAGRV